VMSSSTYVEDVDLKAERYCPDCLDLLANPPESRANAV